MSRAKRFWLRSWVSGRLRAFDESHVVDLGDADDPDVRVVAGVDGSLDDEVPPVRYVHVDGADFLRSLDEAEAKFRDRRLRFFASPPTPSCVFCPEPATEEIFVGWETPPGGLVNPPAAQFARVCIDHVGRSRFTRSDRPVDEL